MPAAGDGDWSKVNLYDMDGKWTWPITLFSYFYVREDLTNMDPRSAGLLKALIEYTLGEDGQESLTDFHFVGVPQEILALNSQTLAMLQLPQNVKVCIFLHGGIVVSGDVCCTQRVIRISRLRMGQSLTVVPVNTPSAGSASPTLILNYLN